MECMYNESLEHLMHRRDIPKEPPNVPKVSFKHNQDTSGTRMGSFFMSAIAKIRKKSVFALLSRN